MRDRGRGAGLGGLPDWLHVVLTAVRLFTDTFLAFVLSFLCLGRQGKRCVFNMLCLMTYAVCARVHVHYHVCWTSYHSCAAVKMHDAMHVVGEDGDTLVGEYKICRGW
eukprot:COSAG01_NODE_10938_length_2043_cov_3.886831_3_plen_108_part_00